jgi:hypothetical protein
VGMGFISYLDIPWNWGSYRLWTILMIIN